MPSFDYFQNSVLKTCLRWGGAQKSKILKMCLRNIIIVWVDYVTRFSMELEYTTLLLYKIKCQKEFSMFIF